MNINVWSGFSKRKNSTKRPSSGTQVAVELKEPTSITAPVFKLSTQGVSVNYVEVPSWGRYYFVTDAIQVTNDIVELHCSVDELASAKSNIQSTNCFVEYAASSSDLTQLDTRNRPTDIVANSTETLTWSGNPFTDTGCYIVGVITDESNGEGGVVTYYALTALQLAVLSANLYDQSVLDTILDEFFGVDRAITSITWVPISTLSITSTTGTFKIGRSPVPNMGSVKKITSRFVSFSASSNAMTFPSGSGAGGAMRYIDKAPYSTGELYLPFVGVVPLDLDIAAFTKSIQIQGDIDVLSGDIVYRVGYGGAMVSTFNGTCATKMPVSNATYDGIGTVTGVLSTIGGAAAIVGTVMTGGTLAALGAGVAASVGGQVGTFKSLSLSTSVNGSNSSALGAKLGTSAWYRIFTYVPATGALDADLLSFQANHGMPYNKPATLSSLSGYIKCAGASVSCPFTDAEKDAINDYLNGGFFLE